jgi:hypothetical protein
MADLIYYTNGGENVSAINCPAGCNHTTPRGVVCLGCQEFPTAARCDTCRIRVDTPATTITIAPGQINDPPGGPTPMTIVSSASGKNQPPGHNS